MADLAKKHLGDVVVPKRETAVDESVAGIYGLIVRKNESEQHGILFLLFSSNRETFERLSIYQEDCWPPEVRDGEKLTLPPNIQRKR